MGGCLAKGGVDAAQRRAAIEKYKLSDEQLAKVETLFYECAHRKSCVRYPGFRSLYAASRFEHSEEDIETVFCVLAKPPSLDGSIDFDSFVRLTLLCNRGKEVEGASDEDRMKVLFDVMDSDHSEAISEAEFQRFVLNFVDDETTTNKMFGRLDSDNSREIDLAEFCSFCKTNRKVYRTMCSYVFPIE